MPIPTRSINPGWSGRCSLASLFSSLTLGRYLPLILLLVLTSTISVHALISSPPSQVEIPARNAGMQVEEEESPPQNSSSGIARAEAAVSGSSQPQLPAWFPERPKALLVSFVVGTSIFIVLTLVGTLVVFQRNLNQIRSRLPESSENDPDLQVDESTAFEISGLIETTDQELSTSCGSPQVA